MNGMALLSWVLTLGTVLLRRHVLRKGDPFCDPVELVEGNPTYSVVRLPDGKESTVPPSDLTPHPPSPDESENPPSTDSTLQETGGVGGVDVRDAAVDEAVDDVQGEVESDEDSVPEKTDSEPVLLRQSTRSRKPLIVMILMSLSLVFNVVMSLCFSFNVKFK